MFWLSIVLDYPLLVFRGLVTCNTYEKVPVWLLLVGSESIPKGEGSWKLESTLQLKKEDPTEDIGEKSLS